MSRIASAQFIPIALPLQHPVSNAKHVLTRREGVVIRLSSEDGISGWGEATPFPGFGLETAAEARRAMEVAAKELIGTPVDLARASQLFVDEACPAAQGALVCAVLDLVARHRGVTLRDLLVETPAVASNAVECNVLITAMEFDDLVCEAEAARSNGFRTFKMKVGACALEVDEARVATLRNALGSRVEIRLDANGAYDLAGAQAAVDRFAKYDIAYLEQPVAADALEAMARLRAFSPVSLAADESATTEADVRRVIDAGAADVIIVKPSAVGGPLAALRCAALARQAGLGVVVTSMLDGAIAVSAALQVAAVLSGQGDLPASGLATSGLFARDIALLPPIRDGRVALSREPGLGIDVEPDLVPGLAGNDASGVSR